MEKNIESDKIRYHCHLTLKYRGPDNNTYVTLKQSNFIPFVFHNFSNYDCHLFFKRLVDKKDDKVKFDNIPKTNEEYISVSFCCIRFIDSYRFLSSSLDSLVKTLVDISHETLKDLKEDIVDNDEISNIVNEREEEDKTFEDSKKDYPDKIGNLEEVLLNYMGEIDRKILKTEFPDNRWNYLTRKVAYRYKFFRSLEDYQKPDVNLKNEDLFSKLNNDYLSVKEIERTIEFF